jgi:hypothetical protein
MSGHGVLRPVFGEDIHNVSLEAKLSKAAEASWKLEQHLVLDPRTGSPSRDGQRRRIRSRAKRAARIGAVGENASWEKCTNGAFESWGQ